MENMSHLSDRRTLLGVVGAMIGGVASGCLSAPEKAAVTYDSWSPPDETWPQLGYDAGHTRHIESQGPIQQPNVRWRSLNASVYPPVVADNLYLTEAWTEGAAFSVKSTDGSMGWINESLPPIRWAPALYENRLIVLSRTEENVFGLHGINVETGDEEWVQKDGITASTSYQPPAGPTVHRDTVYIGSENGIIAYDASTGERRWECIIRRSSQKALKAGRLPSWAQPAVGNNTVVTYDTNEDQGEIREVYGIDRRNGKRSWTANLNLEDGWYLKGYPVIGEGLIFVSAIGPQETAQTEDTEWTGSERLYVIDLETGNLRWDIELTGKTLSPPAYADGELFFGEWHPSRDGSDLRCLSVSNKNENWAHELEEGAISSCTVSKDAVYFGQENQVAAVSRADGSRLWELEVGERVGPLILADNVLYIHTNPGHNSKSEIIALSNS